MNHVTDSVPATLSEAPVTGTNARLAHLFRASLSQGRLHPLYLPMLQYRQADLAQPA